MMKRILLVLAMAAVAVSAYSQEKGFSAGWWYQHGMRSGGSVKYQPLELVMSPAYNFNSKFYVKGDAAFNMAHFKSDLGKDYENVAAFGLGGGWNFYRFDMGYVETFVSAGGTIGSYDWDYLYVDWGMRLNIGRCASRGSFGFGVKYTDSQHSWGRDYWNFYASFGFKFN